MEHKKKLTNSTGCDPPLNKTTPGVDITSGNGVPQSSYTDAVDLTGTNSSSYPLSELSLASIQVNRSLVKLWVFLIIINFKERLAQFKASYGLFDLVLN
jgi:hypothetical protein